MNAGESMLQRGLDDHLFRYSAFVACRTTYVRISRVYVLRSNTSSTAVSFFHIV